MNVRNCRRLIPAASFVLLAGIASGASAIVVRHDVPDAAYLARESEFPAVFSLYRTRAGHNECVATLIHPKFALTAAHCAREKALLDGTGPDGTGYDVWIGGLPARIDRVVHHPGDGGSHAPDLAVLRLAEPVSHVAPLPLYRGTQEVGQVVAMPGWGPKTASSASRRTASTGSTASAWRGASTIPPTARP